MDCRSLNLKLDIEPCAEADLVRCAALGDRAAFGKLIEPHYPTAYRAALRVAGSRQNAEDAVQSACVRMMSKLHTLKSASSFSAWMVRVAINEALQSRRKNQRFQSMPDSYWESHSSELSSPERITTSRHLLNVLGERLREDGVLFVRRYLVGQTFRSLSHETGVSQSALKTRLHRARDRMRTDYARL